MKYILLMFITLLILMTACTTDITCPECQDCGESETSDLCFDSTALIDSGVPGYFENIDDENQGFFTLWLFNYGNAEGRDITIECVLFEYDSEEDVEGEDLIRIEMNVGNIASKSNVYKELEFDMSQISDTKYYQPACRVKSCERCRLLYELIPEMKKESDDFFS